MSCSATLAFPYAILETSLMGVSLVTEKSTGKSQMGGNHDCISSHSGAISLVIVSILAVATHSFFELSLFFIFPSMVPASPQAVHQGESKSKTSAVSVLSARLIRAARVSVTRI